MVKPQAVKEGKEKCQGTEKKMQKEVKRTRVTVKNLLGIVQFLLFSQIFHL